MSKPKIHPHTYNCVECNKETEFRVSKRNIFCSVKCQQDRAYKDAIANWNVKTPGKGRIKRYLAELYGNKCSVCNIETWNNKEIVFELEHIDGNSENNSIENLCLICPNCHSQTPTYKGANKGNGRHYRRVRYAERKSF
jgi:hypothetical protein